MRAHVGAPALPNRGRSLVSVPGANFCMSNQPVAKDPIESQVRRVLERIASDLSLLTDKPFKILASQAGRSRTKPVGAHGVHIAFKLAFEWRGQTLHGALLLPLPEAISLACFLLMLPAEAVAARRAQTQLDQATKDAMLEIGSFIGGAADGALRAHFPQGLSVRSLGCQGLRAGQPPAFPYQAGQELIEGRGSASLGEGAAFELVLILPVISEKSAPVS